MAHKSDRRTRHALTARRGAASLVVVMVLFFIITLVAAYTSRNLIFEQRTSANHYRSTLAFESAEAGAEWVLARLNEGRMDDTCTQLPNPGAVGSPAQPSFRERYLNVDPVTGIITAVPNRRAGCIFNGTTWVCDCPATAATDPAPTVTLTGNGPFPAFWVRFQDVASTRPGLVRMQINACTRSDASCLNFAREAQTGDGLATVWSMVALRSAISSTPAAALTVRGTFNLGAADNDTRITNTDLTSGGFTIHSGGTVNPGGIILTTVPGSLPSQSISQGDASLTFGNLTLTPATPANDGNNRMFASFFGMWPTTYAQQPGIAVVDCPATCNATDVNNAVKLRPGKPVLVVGGGELRIDADIGTALAPVLIIAQGSVEFDSSGRTMYGVVYSASGIWELDGNGTIRGAAIAQNNFEFDDDDLTIQYDRDILQRLRFLNGSFAKVPGGWRDFTE